jgi:hypothetical protein
MYDSYSVAYRERPDEEATLQMIAAIVEVDRGVA